MGEFSLTKTKKEDIILNISKFAEFRLRHLKYRTH